MMSTVSDVIYRPAPFGLNQLSPFQYGVVSRRVKSNGAAPNRLPEELDIEGLN